MALVHELSWSVSRSGTFSNCRRNYYNGYYLAWRGWERGIEPERALAYRLKKLTRLPMHAGDCLHRALSDWFGERKRGETPDVNWVTERALGELRGGYKESRDRAAEWERRPSKSVRLAEHYYGEERVDESGDEARRYGTRYVERIQDGARNFFGMPELERVRNAAPTSYLACEELGTIELFDTKIYAVPDFAMRTDAGEVWIYDWKTGAPREQDVFQLALYALYAEQRFDADPTSVRSADVYLPTGKIVEQSFDRKQLDSTLERVRESIDEMRAVHFNADRGVGDANDFPMVEPGSRECVTCGYRELCGR